MMMIPSSSQALPSFGARSLLYLVFVLVVTGAVIEVAAAPYNRRTRMAGLQNRADGARKPSRTLKQFDPHKPKAQPIRRAGRSRPSPWSGNGQGHEGSDENIDHDGDDNDDNDDDGDNSGDNNEDGDSHNDDDAQDGASKKKGRDSEY
ncbi:hypothetical protein D9756_002014 [Leucocoprinus leucothites]|uniref:Uncharacterized protein n=1 Tax=Leucocoprinus leucothites TaxID=201217 RepID=A0A8H5LLS8_9AGAR|nr:hypothetical protein D9756_002014 [Leucoagaricus leucothites]